LDWHYAGFGPSVHWKYRGPFSPPNRVRQLVVNGLITVFSSAGDIMGNENVSFAGNVSDEGEMGQGQLPIAGTLLSNNTINTTELFFTVSEKRGYTAMKDYIERMQKNVSIKIWCSIFDTKESGTIAPQR
jgi:hypothetical protein